MRDVEGMGRRRVEGRIFKYGRVGRKHLASGGKLKM